MELKMKKILTDDLPVVPTNNLNGETIHSI